MKQIKVSKNTELVSSKNFVDFSYLLLGQYSVKRNKECENNISKFYISNP